MTGQVNLSMTGQVNLSRCMLQVPVMPQTPTSRRTQAHLGKCKYTGPDMAKIREVCCSAQDTKDPQKSCMPLCSPWKGSSI